ncbi:MAG: hypothetical protein LBP20_02650 [Treponema sp.]|jgi:hypothetical protein|nr:hypothetical protein [Treponema sp.]
MGKRNLNTGALLLENLKAKPVRSVCLVEAAGSNISVEKPLKARPGFRAVRWEFPLR